MSTSANNQESKTLLIIDSGVENYEELVAGAEEGVEVHVLTGDSDGIEQITTIINTAASTGVIDALHIVSDGSPGQIQLGNGALSNKTIERYESKLSQWTEALSPEACMLVYASQVAGDDRGKELIDSLGEITGAMMAASEDDTGNAGAGGDWNLEYSTGEIVADLALTPEVREAYSGLLSSVITVTNTNDSGAGSLREAIAQARDGETIIFDSSLANRTITLTSGQLEILDKDLIIDGVDAPGLTISGNERFRVIDVQATNWSLKSIDLTLRDLTIADGRVTGVDEDGSGGGLRTNSGTILTIERVTFKNNFANGEGGGGIFAGFRSINTIIDSHFEENTSLANHSATEKSERGGGAIAVKSESATAVTGSTFRNNNGIGGGAINTLLGELIVENSDFIGNDTTAGGGEDFRTQQGFGGAIYTDGASAKYDGSTSGIIRISNSHFEDNIAAGQGGAMRLEAYGGDTIIVENNTIINNRVIQNSMGSSNGGGLMLSRGRTGEISNTTFANNVAEGGQGGGFFVSENVSEATIRNSTFSGNRATSTVDGDFGSGGGLTLNRSTDIEIINTTVVNNYAGLAGGGFVRGGSNVTLTNSIVAYNVADEPSNRIKRNQNTTDQLRDGGGNIQYVAENPEGPLVEDTLVTAGVTLADPMLDELQEINGVLVHPLLPGSPAIDGGVNGGAPATDQLGTERPIDGDGNGRASVDSGAYEFSGDSEPPADGCSLDIDDNGEIDPFTDGRLIMFYLFFGNLEAIDHDVMEDVFGSAIGPGANPKTIDEITNYLDSARDTMLDVDGNGVADAQTDGILIMRYMFEITGESLISGALAPDATRITPEAIIEFLQQCDPQVTGIEAEAPLTTPSIGF
ncbi:MAG: DUF4347 domain-containing protein [Hormoscilla sp.]